MLEKLKAYKASLEKKEVELLDEIKKIQAKVAVVDEMIGEESLVVDTPVEALPVEEVVPEIKPATVTFTR